MNYYPLPAKCVCLYKYMKITWLRRGLTVRQSVAVCVAGIATTNEDVIDDTNRIRGIDFLVTNDIGIPWRGVA